MTHCATSDVNQVNRTIAEGLKPNVRGVVRGRVHDL